MALDHPSLMRLFDRMDEGLMIIDGNWRILHANDAGRRYLGLSASETRIREDLIPKLSSSFILSKDLALATSADEEQSIDFQASNLPDASYEMTLSVYLSRPTEEGYRILLIRDVTEEHREASIKREFLSLISHKLRTPMGVLKMGLSNLQESITGPLNDRQRRLVETSQKQLSRLEGMIDRMIAFTALQHERLRHDAGTIDAIAVVRECCEEYARRPLPKPLRVTYEDASGPCRIAFRRSLFVNLLHCLLDNAIKFSQKPEVSLSISCRSAGSNSERVLEIRDDGPGLPPAILAKTFQAFTQHDEDFTGNIEGLGLGLPTVHSLMGLYGGQVQIECPPGKGTWVRLIFPPAPQPQKTPSQA